MSRRGALAAVPDAPTTPAPMVAQGWDLRDYPHHYLLCRGYRHSFPPPEEQTRWTRIINAAGQPIEYRHALVCRRCQLMLTEVVDARTGHRHRELPAYPDGYLRKGLGRLPMWQVHLEEIRRLEEQLGRNFDTVVADGT